MEYWWFFIIVLIAAGARDSANARRTRLLQRKVAFLFRRIDLDPAALEAEFRQDEARQAQARRRTGTVGGLLGAAVGAASLGALAWAFNGVEGVAVGAASGGVIGGLFGLVVGLAVHEHRTADRHPGEQPGRQSP